ncbi:bifunctional polynucleotide phosphatase/kinase [Favolaschia claudopus]|uniref:Bifunctional polynucleotide phosphatase/kinase n=1 Tax=Favolaschia claudopus TaxID=2862362 RepID=A0AAW0EHJ0_9AGAR
MVSSLQASTTLKRTASQLDPEESSTSNNVSRKTSTSTPNEKLSSLQWRDSLGPYHSCLHAINLNPKHSTKVAAFDLDGTIIKGGTKQPAHEWRWWNPCVPDKLAQAFNDGYAIVIISNQAGLGGKYEVETKPWKTKLASISGALPELPLRLFAAIKRDKYRKPMLGMWEELESIYAADGIEIDKASSFFVGDGAGRNYPKNPMRSDFSSTDRKWAINAGISFLTPEEYFLGEAPDPDFTLKGLDVSALPTKLPLYTPSSSPLIPNPPIQELVLFVGYPCLGKTTFFPRYFEPAGYLHVTQDALKSGVQVVHNALAAGKKCVVDNTNQDTFTRKFYIDIADKLGVPVRCMLFTGSLDLAWHNNLYRSTGLPPSVAEREIPREALPKSAFSSFRDNYKAPKLREGFLHIKKVNWIFSGTPEERKAWSKWFSLFDETDERGRHSN